MGIQAYNWPLVDEHDDGIRPAGLLDECFYCLQRIGYLHDSTCTIVMKRVEMRVTATLTNGETITGLWQFNEPHYWDSRRSEFHKNESTWCKGNILDEDVRSTITWDVADAWNKLDQDRGDNVCLCGVLSFTFVRVVDPTPQRKLRYTGLLQ